MPPVPRHTWTCLLFASTVVRAWWAIKNVPFLPEQVETIDKPLYFNHTSSDAEADLPFNTPVSTVSDSALSFVKSWGRPSGSVVAAQSFNCIDGIIVLGVDVLGAKKMRMKLGMEPFNES